MRPDEPSTSMNNHCIPVSPHSSSTAIAPRSSSHASSPEDHRHCQPPAIVRLRPVTCFGILRVALLVAAMLPLVSGSCFYFGPGMTIHGSDYRRDYGITQKDCAILCKSDICCMGFEFNEGECTLKSRSLNGTISNKPNSIFGLCLNTDDDDRDQFWDHELSGVIVAEQPLIHRDKCAEYCNQYEGDPITIYSWRSSNHRDMDEPMGQCTCIGVLHAIMVSFGSFAGILA